MIAVIIGDGIGILFTVRQDLEVPWWIWPIPAMTALCFAQFMAFHEMTVSRQKVRDQLESLLEGPLMDFGGFNMAALLHKEDSSLADFDITLHFDNVSSSRIRYNVKNIQVEIAGKTATQPKFDNRGGIILPAKQSHFLYPVITNVDISKSPINGRIEYSLDYATIPEIRKFRQRREIALTLYPPKDPAFSNWYIRHTFLDAPDDERIG
ncbi:MAG TPA: hypothetical protein VNL15_01375 [Dehalococcoidia bacterium]|nr:hypothetical protein [Dehalococcoidia bacterium]